jgi:hypothetical protein
MTLTASAATATAATTTDFLTFFSLDRIGRQLQGRLHGIGARANLVMRL